MNLNEYFKNRRFFKNKIIVISAKDSASRYKSEFFAKSNLGLALPLMYRDAYVAVVDMKRGFVFEKHSKEKYECSYQVKDRFIDMVSAGYNTGNCSSIKINEQEFSCNKNGLNFAIFHYKSLELVDKFYVNTHSDKGLTIQR